MDISCAFPPVPGTPDHIALAERLGYRRAGVYDTPALHLAAGAAPSRGFAWSAPLGFCAVLDPRDAFESPGVFEVGGAGAAVAFNRPFAVPAAPGRRSFAGLPGGTAWRAAMEAVPQREGQLHAHEGN